MAKELQASTKHGVVHIPLSTSYLMSAVDGAKRAEELEQIGTPSIREHYSQRGQVMSSIAASAFFLEACINELLSRCTHSSGIRLGPHSERVTKGVMKQLGALWQSDGFESLKTLGKFQIVLGIAGAELLEKGANPYQNAALVIGLRNELVHFKPEWQQTARGLETQLEVDHRLAKQLAGRFPPNPFAMKYSILGSLPDGGPIPTEYAFFPEKCLGSGCARWALRSVLEFADEFFRRLEIPPSYEHVFSKGHLVRLDCLAPR